MKLYKFVLLGIIILSLILGTRRTREGMSYAEVLRRQKAAITEKAAAKKTAYAKQEYGGVIAIQKQLILLKTIKDRVKRVPSFELEPKPRKEINDSLDTIITSLQSWLDNRIKYLKINNKTPIAPSESQSIDGLRKMWNNNGIGLKVLVDGITERLNISEDSQNDVDKLLKTFVTSMNMELGIVLSDAPQESDDYTGDLGKTGDYEMDTLDNIFSKGMFNFGYTEKENLTYEEQYS